MSRDVATVRVTVDGRKITVEPYDLSMVGRGRNAPIEWVMTNGGGTSASKGIFSALWRHLRRCLRRCLRREPTWVFPPNGIVIQGNDGQFTQLRPDEKGSKFTCVDQNTDGKTYKYDVNVTNGKDTLTLDPTIRNGTP